MLPSASPGVIHQTRLGTSQYEREVSSMRKLKKWANANNWWLPWIGATATIASLMFPAAFLKTGEMITSILLFLRKHWRFSIIACWGLYTHLEVLKLKSRKPN